MSVALDFRHTLVVWQMGQHLEQFVACGAARAVRGLDVRAGSPRMLTGSLRIGQSEGQCWMSAGQGQPGHAWLRQSMNEYYCHSLSGYVHSGPG